PFRAPRTPGRSGRTVLRSGTFTSFFSALWHLPRRDQLAPRGLGGGAHLRAGAGVERYGLPGRHQTHEVPVAQLADGELRAGEVVDQGVVGFGLGQVARAEAVEELHHDFGLAGGELGVLELLVEARLVGGAAAREVAELHDGGTPGGGVL